MKLATIAASLVLASCSSEQSPDPSAAVESSGSPNQARKSAPTAKAHLIEEQLDVLEFSYGWPAEAAAIPALARRFEADLVKQRTEALAQAREDKAGRTADVPFNGHYFSAKWDTVGAARTLLSLAVEISTFTGGAHPNTVYSALLWDKAAGREIEAADLFADPAAAFEALRPGYCAELDRQRAEKRGETLPLSGEGWMVDCPPLAEQAIAPIDADGDGRFERLRVLISPYGAGPYAEGSYEVDLPAAAVRTLVKREYTGAF